MDLNKPSNDANKASKQLKKQLLSIESDLVEMIIDYVLQLDTKKGQLIASVSNTQSIAQLTKVIQDKLQLLGFNDFVTDYLVNFDDLTDYSIALHKDLNGLNVAKGRLNKYKKLAISQVLENMIGAGLQSSVVLPLQNVLTENILQGGGLTDLIKDLRQQLQSNQTLGLVTSHLTQISRDGLMQYNGTTHAIIQKQYNLNAIRYIGSLVDDSRKQCKRWVNYRKNGKKGIILIDDLQKEINWAKRNGNGFIRSTTVSNFIINRGGFNCRHTAIPIRI